MKTKDRISQITFKNRCFILTIVIFLAVVDISMFQLALKGGGEGMDEFGLAAMLMAVFTAVPAAVCLICYILSEVFLKKVREKTNAYVLPVCWISAHGITAAVLLLPTLLGFASDVSGFAFMLFIILVMGTCGVLGFKGGIDVKREVDSKRE